MSAGALRRGTAFTAVDRLTQRHPSSLFPLAPGLDREADLAPLGQGARIEVREGRGVHEQVGGTGPDDEPEAALGVVEAHRAVRRPG